MLCHSGLAPCFHLDDCALGLFLALAFLLRFSKFASVHLQLYIYAIKQLEQKTELNAYNKNDDNQLQEKDLSTNRPILPPNQEEIKETQSPINYPSILIHQVEDNNINNNNNNNNNIYTVKIKKSDKVIDLKKEIAKQSDLPAEGQNLVYKGKILNDDKTIQDYELQTDHTVILVRKANYKPETTSSTTTSTSTEQQQQPQSQSSQSQPQNNTSQHNANPFGAFGMGGMPNLSGFEGMSGFDMGGMGMGGMGMPGMGGMNPMMAMQMLQSNPQLLQQFSAMMQNPEAVNMLLNNPQLKPLLDSNPQMREILSNPQMRQQMFSPQNMQMMMNMMQGMGGMGMPGMGMGGMGMNGFGGMPQQQTGSNAGSSSSGGSSSSMGFNPFAFYGGGMPQQQQQQQQQDQNVDYKVLYKEQLEKLKEMGFVNEDVNINILKQCQGNVDFAVEKLLSMLP